MTRLVSCARALIVGGCFTAAYAVTSPIALADELPVVSIHNEIGIAAEGQLLNYKENFPFAGARDRENGWAPGVNFSGQAMFNAYGIKHIYASLDYGIVSGQATYTGATIRGDVPLSFQHSVAMRDLNVEFGKGFEFVGGRLLVTPVLQFGHHAWDRDFSYSETYHSMYFGGAVHVDYALTSRLVLSGRLGLAEIFAAGMDLSGYTVEGYDGTPVATSTGHFTLGAQPVWQAGIGLDYAITKRFHVFGKVNFQRFGYALGSTTLTGTYHGRSVTVASIEPNSWTQTVTPLVGIAYAF